MRSSTVVAVYTGKIGIEEGLENVTEVASCLKNRDETPSLLVGKGMEKASQRRKASEMELKNVKLLDLQLLSVLPQMLAAAEIPVLNVRASRVNTCLPTKLLTSMASAKRVIAAVHPDSEPARRIRAADCGLVVPAETLHLLAKARAGQPSRWESGTFSRHVPLGSSTMEQLKFPGDIENALEKCARRISISTQQDLWSISIISF